MGGAITKLLKQMFVNLQNSNISLTIGEPNFSEPVYTNRFKVNTADPRQTATVKSWLV